MGKFEDEFAAFVDEGRKAVAGFDAIRVPEIERAYAEFLAEARPEVVHVARLVREIRNADLPPRIRAIFRQLLPWIVRGLQHKRSRVRQRSARQRGQKISADKRREALAAIETDLAKIKKRGKAKTDKAAAIVYLAKHDPLWAVGTNEEQKTHQKTALDSFLRRLRTYRKKSADPQ